MGRAISTDLRLRSVASLCDLSMVWGIWAGKSRREVADQFEVAPLTAVRVQARYGATGSVEPVKQGRPKGSGKLGPYGAALTDQVTKRDSVNSERNDLN